MAGKFGSVGANKANAAKRIIRIITPLLVYKKMKGNEIMEIVKVGKSNLNVKTWKNQRVVTFVDIDRVHQRPQGTQRE